MIIAGDEEGSIIPRDGSFAKKDQISELPDDIRLAILSLLEMKDAARTSVLSKRWKYLWTYNLHDLDFDVERYLGLTPCDSAFYPHKKYLSWVNQVIEAHTAPMVKKFRVCNNLNGDYTLSIDRWLNFCLMKGVQELELDCAGKSGNCHVNYFTFESMWQMCLNRDVCMMPTFTNLRSFCAVSIRISGPLLEAMLSDCLLLEQLCLKWCKVMGGLKVVGSSLKLKQLEFWTTAVEKVEVAAPNLKTIVCWSNGGHLDLIEYKSVPSLIDATFGGVKVKDLVYQFSSCSFQLEKLWISTYWDCLCSIAIPPLYNLKQLRIEVNDCGHDDDGADILYLTRWLDACPLLCEFKLEVTCFFKPSYYKRWQETASMYRCLEAVHLIGVDGRRKGGVMFIQYLLKSSPVLKNVTMDSRDTLFLGTGKDYRRRGKTEKSRQALESLAKLFPPAVNVVVI